eukprot:m.23554 g.23554  ORF g.23554 m.23554 type:complete len:135 (+) comp8998_c0_seq1:62-466(+)
MEKYLSCLRAAVSCARAERIHRVATSRLKGVTCVIEGLQDTGNVSAVQRTCEAFGILNVHSIKRFPFDTWKQHRRISKGAEKWYVLVEIEAILVCCANFSSSTLYKEQGFFAVIFQFLFSLLFSFILLSFVCCL